MIVKIIPSRNEKRKWSVEISQGVQHFTLDYDGNLNEAEWMARMFRHAIRHHNREILKRANAKKEPGGK